jgi:hypothetical protein
VETRREPLANERGTALKKWLGLRYDRPAVPEALLPLANAIAAAVKSTRTPELADGTHDVLFQVEAGTPPRYRLLAVLRDEGMALDAEEWLAKAALEIDPDVGLMGEVPYAATKDHVSVRAVENSYSADLSDITWRKKVPRGAE